MKGLFIFTNDGTPDIVRMGWSEDIEKKRKELSNPDYVAKPYKLYAWYKTTDLSDTDAIDWLNCIIPASQGKSSYNKGFFNLSPDMALNLFLAMANLTDTLDNLHTPDNLQENQSTDKEKWQQVKGDDYSITVGEKEFKYSFTTWKDVFVNYLDKVLEIHPDADFKKLINYKAKSPLFADERVTENTDMAPFYREVNGTFIYTNGSRWEQRQKCKNIQKCYPDVKLNCDWKM